MARTALLNAISKLALAGESAGFTVEQMVQLLNDGLDVSTLASMIEWKLAYTEQKAPVLSPHRWVC